ncbi:MAG: hypothetical protein OXH71_02020 [Candidatus Dadabacteria bacterium]|nr:hypothetical protein [Candidatus Dadabacteria bacterium]
MARDLVPMFQPDLEEYDYDIARKYVEDAVTGPVLKRFVEKERIRGKNEKFPVAVLNAETKRLTGQAKFQAVRMRHGVMRKITGKHSDITIEDMLRAQEAVDDGMVIQPKKNPLKREFFLEVGEVLYVFPHVPTKTGLQVKTFFKKTEGKEDFLKAKKAEGKVLRKQKR